jgi:xanthine dehydrogenase YagT iron-sulfur-binding subunit
MANPSSACPSHHGTSEKEIAGGLSRRVLLTAGVSAAMTAPLAGPAGADIAAANVPANAPLPGEGRFMGITLKVNGRSHNLALDPRTTLLDALREKLGLTGSKKGCDHGQCGACTVHVDGRRVLSCLTLAASVRGAVTTIEGLSHDGVLHPMQQAFLDHDAFQCGYCTPGQIMSAVACIQEGRAGSAAEIREYMSGNLCRCAAYPHIVAAIQQARPQMKGS